MAVIVSGSAEVGSAIGYHNLFVETGVTVTASSESTGYEKENAYDWKQYDWWKPTALGTEWIRVSFGLAKSASYFAVFGHNLHEVGGSVKAQYSTNAGSTWNDATTDVTPADGATIFRVFSDTLASDWRILVTTTTGQAIIAGVMIGEVTLFNKGLEPGLDIPALAPMVESKTPMSELGVNLGASIKATGVRGSISMSNIDPAWMRSTFKPLVTHLNEGKPCVFSWDYNSHPWEALLIWKRGDINPPSYSGPILMAATIQFEGVL